MKQVDKEHYYFNAYVDKKRWMSFWYQFNEILSLNPVSILEIGPGPGLFKGLAELFYFEIETLDIDPDLDPDYVASATDIPLADRSFDCICAFQVLEHLPYKQSLKAVGEMSRIARKNVVISLPDALVPWVYALHVPKIGQKIIHIPKPRLRLPNREFNGEHYWEINSRGYPLHKIIEDFSQFDIDLIRTYKAKENPYHRFFIFSKEFSE